VQRDERQGMRLTRLRLNGFKSFADPTELAIAPGLTGVVGPNGCGKSNLLKRCAGSWARRGPPQMRGQGMEDVIFAGTARTGARGPMPRWRCISRRGGGRDRSSCRPHLARWRLGLSAGGQGGAGPGHPGDVRGRGLGARSRRPWCGRGRSASSSGQKPQARRRSDRGSGGDRGAAGAAGRGRGQAVGGGGEPRPRGGGDGRAGGAAQRAGAAGA
jgi:energy-coupling factor transporter ATP-binding protein EcfA2